MNSDFKELLQIFDEEGVEYLVVGGYAVIHYSQPRYTKGLDLWLRPTPTNANKVMPAFARFGIALIDVTEDDFAQEGTQYMIGASPVQIDFLTSLPGLDFDQAWQARTTAAAEGIEIQFLGTRELVTAKRLAGRHQDLADIDELRRAGFEVDDQ